MKKIFLPILLMLVCATGAWAKTWSGREASSRFLPAVQNGDQIEASFRMSKSMGKYDEYNVTFRDDKFRGATIVLAAESWYVSSAFDDSNYNDYKLLNPNYSSDKLIVTNIYCDDYGSRPVLHAYKITGHFSGFYTKAEMKTALQTFLQEHGAADFYIAVVMAQIENTSDLAAARAIYDSEYDKALVPGARAEAIAAIDAELGDITDPTLLATIDGYKTQINAATTTAQISTIRNQAITAINNYKAEQARLLAEVKTDAIADIRAAMTTDELITSIANRYIAAIQAATTVEQVDALREKALDIIDKLKNDATALTFGFSGTGNPIETQHDLLHTVITFSNNGEQMTVSIHGATATYPLSQLSGIEHLLGTPSVTLTAHEDPQHTGDFYTTFYSGLEAYALPEGVTAYTAALDAGNSSVTITSIEGDVLPQGEAVLLKSTSGSITLQTVEPEPASPANAFAGVDVATETSDLGAGSLYILSAQNSEMAFYRYMGDTMPANKAYLPIAPGTPTPTRIVWSTEQSEVATGVENTNNNANVNDNANKVLRNGVLYIIKHGHVYTAQGMPVGEIEE